MENSRGGFIQMCEFTMPFYPPDCGTPVPEYVDLFGDGTLFRREVLNESFLTPPYTQLEEKLAELGMQLASNSQVRSMASLGYTFAPDGSGVWIGSDSDLLDASRLSVHVPAYAQVVTIAGEDTAYLRVYFPSGISTGDDSWHTDPRYVWGIKIQ